MRDKKLVRVKVSFAKGTLIHVVLESVGLFLFIFNGINLWNWYHPVPIEKALAEGFKRGTYIEYNISEYLIKPLDYSYATISTTYIGMGKNYDVYTIPVGDENMVRVMIYDEETLAALQRFNRGKGGSVKVFGKVKKYDFTTEWYDGIEGFDKSSLVPDTFIMQYKSNLASINWFTTGIVMFVVGVGVLINQTSVKEND